MKGIDLPAGMKGNVPDELLRQIDVVVPTIDISTPPQLTKAEFLRRLYQGSSRVEFQIAELPEEAGLTMIPSPIGRAWHPRDSSALMKWAARFGPAWSVFEDDTLGIDGSVIFIHRDEEAGGLP